MKLKTLTIGIPAFNEEANIIHLLNDVINQNTKGFVLEEIFVASDNSTDKTNNLVLEYMHKNKQTQKIKLLAGKKREGQAVRQNEIFKVAKSDVVVLLNADILIKDTKFLQKLVSPILAGSADLTSSFPLPLKPEGLIEKILYTSVIMKTNLFESYKNGNNIYTCHGRARAFSKRLYKEMRFIDSIGEDAYSYLYTVTHKFEYKSVHSAKVYYKLPNTFSDHANQSVRFTKTKKMLTKNFGKKTVEREFKIPVIHVIKSLFTSLMQSPVEVFSYLVMLLALKSGIFKDSNIKNTWKISQSSKQLRKA